MNDSIPMIFVKHQHPTKTKKTSCLGYAVLIETWIVVDTWRNAVYMCGWGFDQYPNRSLPATLSLVKRFKLSGYRLSTNFPAFQPPENIWKNKKNRVPVCFVRFVWAGSNLGKFNFDLHFQFTDLGIPWDTNQSYGLCGLGRWAPEDSELLLHLFKGICNVGRSKFFPVLTG